ETIMEQLTGTAYGRVLLAKVLLMAGVAALALWARIRLARAADPLSACSPARAEVFVLGLVVAVSGLLTALPVPIRWCRRGPPARRNTGPDTSSGRRPCLRPRPGTPPWPPGPSAARRPGTHTKGSSRTFPASQRPRAARHLTDRTVGRAPYPQ